MGVRSRIKSKIKKMLLKPKENKPTTQPSAVSSPPPSWKEEQPKEPIQSPSQPEEVAPIATEQEEVTAVSSEQKLVEKSSSTSLELESPATVDSTIEVPTPSVETESEAEKVQETKGNGIDTTGASAVFNVSNIFPETCPNCGITSYGNWSYTDREFVCTACDTPY